MGSRTPLNSSLNAFLVMLSCFCLGLFVDVSAMAYG